MFIVFPIAPISTVQCLLYGPTSQLQMSYPYVCAILLWPTPMFVHEGRNMFVLLPGPFTACGAKLW